MIPKEAAAEATKELFTRWYLPPFLSTLENKYGIVVRDAERIKDLLKIATVLQYADSKHRQDTENAKVNASETLVKDASNEIVKKVTGTDNNTLQEESLKQAAARAAVLQDETLRKHALTYGYLAAGGKIV